MQQPFSKNQILWMTITGLIIGPFIEELSYRAIGLKYVFRNYEIIGMMILSCVFAFTHYPNSTIDFLIYFQSSIIYSIIYLKSRRFELVLILHILNNSFTFILMLIESF
ncbi:CPBP family intramembrane metalloprotease [Staphylococcus hyicus]|uniref:CPBP family intramembrane metalloprotease n=2 Tax=Staphylococcus hyicus TaxID=1284 RepID=A0A418JIM9_STAHY|nr:CPBP family intramembrane metalloprotease [Staphylococcus hyicus]RIO45615.1 CPBP family intramembrane metalloprotease [Staphylococcus hyicus]